jgi:adenosylhomocysteine nucleosidase
VPRPSSSPASPAASATRARVGDVVVARELLQHDLDASPLFPRHEVPLTGRALLRATPALSDALGAGGAPTRSRHAASRRSARPLGLAVGLGGAAGCTRGWCVRAATASSPPPAEGAALRARAAGDALAVEMEGAALAQVYHDCDLPFALLRTMPDRADDSAHLELSRFLATVAGPLGAVLRAWLRRGGGAVGSWRR